MSWVELVYMLPNDSRILVFMDDPAYELNVFLQNYMMFPSGTYTYVCHEPCLLDLTRKGKTLRFQYLEAWKETMLEPIDEFVDPDMILLLYKDSVRHLSRLSRVMKLRKNYGMHLVSVNNDNIVYTSI